MSDLIQWAQEFATEAHGAIKQKRKYTGVNYISQSPVPRPTTSGRITQPQPEPPHMPVQTRKKRIQFPQREDMGPTRERRQHQDFRTTNGTTRVVSTVEVLRNCGDIGDDEVSAAERWRRDFDFADHAYLEVSEARASDSGKGDVHTFAVSRAKASKHMSLARAAVGLCGHTLLHMMLAQEMTFTAMGAILHPNIDPSRSRAKTSAKCEIVLKRLSEHYRELAKTRARDKLLADRLGACV